MQKCARNLAVLLPTSLIINYHFSMMEGYNSLRIIKIILN